MDPNDDQSLDADGCAPAGYYDSSMSTTGQGFPAMASFAGVQSWMGQGGDGVAGTNTVDAMAIPLVLFEIDGTPAGCSAAPHE